MDDPYIELNAFLKCKGIVPTGGQAKTLIRSEAVLVNGVIETRNKKKLRVGDKVTYDTKEYIVDSAVLRL
ncbi:MAG: RNA-binding S4 domain-containing protein [Candidatus Woesearchaeota archaeon]